jgi:putative sporulation protein YtxC
MKITEETVSYVAALAKLTVSEEEKQKVALDLNKILEYIIENTDIVLEGFLRFRLKELNADLEDIVDRVVEEYLIEREYDEFIKLLKYFVEIQESRIEIVNIVIEDNGTYCMYDSSYNEITDELIQDIAGEVLTGEVSYDDLLVSSLITLAPRYIVIHNLSNVRNKEIIDTIRNVFADRVRICTGCDLCIKTNPLHRI